MVLFRYIPLATLLGILISPLVLLGQCTQIDWTFSKDQTLGKNTFLIFLGTAMVILPFATVFLLFIVQSKAISRSIQHFVWLLILAIPLPIQIAGVRAFLSLLNLNNGMNSFQGAILFHSLNGLPWIILILSIGANSTQRAWLSTTRVFASNKGWHARVVFNYCFPVILFAFWFILCQVINDISINDLMQIDTYSSDIYVQLISSDPSIPVIIPIEFVVIIFFLLITLYLFIRLVFRSHFSLGEPEWTSHPSPNPSGLERFWSFAFLIATGVPLISFPIYGLIQMSGTDGLHQSWNWVTFLSQLQQSAVTDSPSIIRSFIVAIISGAFCGIVGSYLAWNIISGHNISFLIVCVLAFLYLLPGPLLGITIQNLYLHLLNYSHDYSQIPANLLWHGPSIFPLIHVHFLRFIPMATCISFLGLSISGKSLKDISQLAIPSETLRFIRLGLLGNRQTLFQVMALIGLLTFGEVAASKIVSTPGADSFAEMIWSRLHYGISKDLSSSCLLFLFFSLPCLVVVSWQIGFFSIESRRLD